MTGRWITSRIVAFILIYHPHKHIDLKDALKFRLVGRDFWWRQWGFHHSESDLNHSFSYETRTGVVDSYSVDVDGTGKEFQRDQFCLVVLKTCAALPQWLLFTRIYLRGAMIRHKGSFVRWGCHCGDYKGCRPWDVTKCGSFGGTYRLRHQGNKNRWARNNVSSKWQPKHAAKYQWLLRGTADNTRCTIV
jgi:hypothetical protein